MGHFTTFEESEIAAFRNVPGPGRFLRDRGTKGLDSVIESLIERYHLDRETPEETILANWNSIIGPTFAKRCCPERITASGSLVIAVPNATLRRELMFMEDRILTAVGSLPGCSHIRSVVLKSGN